MPDIDPVFSDLTPSIGSNFNVSQWYYSSFAPGIPDTVAPYLAAHGFLVVGGAPYHIDGEHAGFLLNMNRITFSHADSIQVMLNAMVFAYNEGRTLNDRRYDDLVAGWKESLAFQQEEADSIETAFNASHTLLVADLDAITVGAPTLEEWTSALATLNAKLDEYDVDVAELIASYSLDGTALNTAITTSFTQLTNALNTYRQEVATLKTKQLAVETNIGAVITTETSALTGDVTQINAALDELDGEYDTHLASANAASAAMELAITSFATDSSTIIDTLEAEQTAHESVIATLLSEITAAFTATESTLTGLLSDLTSDYSSHVTTATAFLTDLGATELARINEKYDSIKANQNQNLVSRGFSSSAIVTQMEIQVERERNQELVQHNDLINREKFENQHRLYGQQQALRGSHIGLHQQLLSAEQQTIQYRTDSTERLNNQSQDIRRLSLQSRQETERMRAELFRLQVAVSESYSQIFLGIKTQAVSGKSEIQRARVAVSRGHAEDYQRIFTQIAETFSRSLSGEDRFAGLDAQLRGQQQTILARLEDLGQSWTQTQAGMLESGISRRGDSASVDSQVRQAYYDTIIRQRVAVSQGRLSGATAKGELLRSLVNETTNVAAALFGFAERREDTYPGIGDMAGLVTSLGDDQ